MSLRFLIPLSALACFTCLSFNPNNKTSSMSVNLGVLLLSSMSRGSYAIFFSNDGEAWSLVLWFAVWLDSVVLSSEFAEVPATLRRVIVDMLCEQTILSYSCNVTMFFFSFRVRREEKRLLKARKIGVRQIVCVTIDYRATFESDPTSTFVGCSSLWV